MQLHCNGIRRKTLRKSGPQTLFPTPVTPNNAKKPSLAETLEADLLRIHGAVFIGGRELREALRFKTDIAFRVAMSKRRLECPYSSCLDDEGTGP